MQTLEIFQDNFCFGEISPLHGHELLENYKVSLSKLHNAIVLPSARIRQRPSFIGMPQYKEIKRLSAEDPPQYEEIKGQVVMYMNNIYWNDKQCILFISVKEEDLLMLQGHTDAIKLDISIYGSDNILLTQSDFNCNSSILEDFLLAKKDNKCTLDPAINNTICLLQSKSCIFLFSNYFSPKVIKETKDIVVSEIDKSLWNKYRLFPSKAVIYMDRLWVTSSVAQPNTWWVSGIGYPNFPNEYNKFVSDSPDGSNRREAPIYTSIVEPEEDQESIDSGFWFRTSDSHPTPVQWVIASRNIFFGTQDNEYSIRPINQYKTLTMNNLKVSVESGIGSSDVEPVVLNKECLFVDRTKHKLFLFATDSTSVGQKPMEISFLSDHLLGGDGTKNKKSIVQLVYQEDPYNIIWCVMSDGTLVSLTYHEQQKILGWASHSIFGESISNNGRNFGVIYTKFIQGSCLGSKDLYFAGINNLGNSVLLKLNEYDDNSILKDLNVNEKNITLEERNYAYTRWKMGEDEEGNSIVTDEEEDSEEYVKSKAESDSLYHTKIKDMSQDNIEFLSKEFKKHNIICEFLNHTQFLIDNLDYYIENYYFITKEKIWEHVRDITGREGIISSIYNYEGHNIPLHCQSKVTIETNNLFYNQESNTHIKSFEKKDIKLGVYLFSPNDVTGELTLNNKNISYNFSGKVYKNIANAFSENYSDTIKIKLELINQKPITILGFHAKYVIKEIDKNY